MNLLEIAPEKLLTILHSDENRGLEEDLVRQNRREFGRNTPQSSLFTLSAVFKGLFSSALFSVFYLLCFFALFTSQSAVGAICLIVSAVCFFAFFVFCRWAAGPLDMARKRLRKPATVIRSGKRRSIDPRELVPGDLVLVRPGEAIGFDGLLIRGDELNVLCPFAPDYSVPRKKRPYRELSDASGSEPDDCKLFCGSAILSGEATVLVCNTGKQIRKGNRFAEKQADLLPQPIRRLEEWARRISLWMILATVVLFLIGILVQADTFDLFFLLTALAVSALPETAAMLTKLAVVFSLSQLEKNGCVVQNYAALDKLLAADRILVDSVSYFLDPEIVPSSYFFDNYPRSVRELSEGLFTLFAYSKLCCESDDDKHQMWYGGRSIDRAIRHAADRFGVDDAYLSRTFLPISRTSYDARGFSSTLALQSEKCYLILRGQPIDILDRCTHVLHQSRNVLLSDSGKARLYQAARELAESNEVVVAVARRFFRSPPETPLPDDAFTHLTFVGFLSFYTPMRPESAESVLACREDGVDVILATDSEPGATLGIAQNMEFFRPGENPSLIPGDRMSRLHGEIAQRIYNENFVFCGLDPKQKSELVQAQEAAGHTVVCCTHGQSDLLSENAASVSAALVDEPCFALKKNADLLLSHERFELLPEAIRTSRTVYRNSLKILTLFFLLTASLFCAALTSLVCCGKNLILLPLPVLILGLFLFILYALTLLTDRIQTGIRPLNVSDFLQTRIRSLLLYAVLCGALSGLMTLCSYLLSPLINLTAAQGRTCVILTLYASVLFCFFDLRAITLTVRRKTAFNPYAFACIPVTLGVMACFAFSPALQQHLGLSALTAEGFALSLGCAIVPLVFGAVFRLIQSRGFSEKPRKRQSKS